MQINSAAPLCAHYFASKKQKYVDITAGPSLSDPNAIRVNVSGKAEARKVAAQYGAKPHNF